MDVLTLLLIGLAYILLVGGLAWFRHEGLSVRFALEALGVTGVVVALAALTAFPTSPVLFLIVLYLVTMRVRLLIDLASMLARQGKLSAARRLYALAWRLWPDITGELILKVNQATLSLQEKKLDEAIALFTEVLGQAGKGYFGAKYEAAAHYNLGVAYLRKDLEARAVVEFNAAIDAWPMSVYARHAALALKKRHPKGDAAGEE